MTVAWYGSETRALSPQPPLPILGEGEKAL